MRLSTIVKSFKDLNILVIGDVMVDTYLVGKSNRISPEAPVPIVDVERVDHRLGGAANVALNLAHLGVNTFLCSVCGDDELKSTLFKILSENKIPTDHIVTDENRTTTEKTRIMSQGKHIIRFDKETATEISDKIKQSLLSQIKLLVSKEKLNAIILQDYNKGIFSADLIESIIHLGRSNDIFVSVDPKRRGFFDFKNVDLFKPNLVEVLDALMIEVNPSDESSLQQACEMLSDRLQCTNVLLTLSDKGIYYFNKETGGKIIRAHLRNIIDVSGAGDTVISVATASLAVDPDTSKAAVLSNLAGGLVCEKVGVCPISSSELMDALRQDNAEEVRMLY